MCYGKYDFESDFDFSISVYFILITFYPSFFLIISFKLLLKTLFIRVFWDFNAFEFSFIFLILANLYLCYFLLVYFLNINEYSY